jgi:hypothetical protein
MRRDALTAAWLLVVASLGCGGEEQSAGPGPAAAAAGSAAGAGGRGQYSDLWGQGGELWTPASRLPDVSFAGYERGEQPIPSPAVVANVKDFGAKGDGIADDTRAFQAAIQATSGGAILVPAGRYTITDFVTIDKANLVLRGERRDKTVLWFPRTLTDVKPNWGETTTGQRTSNYSWGGGYLVLSGSFSQQTLASVTATAKRGESWLSVSSVAGFSVGQWVDVRVTDDDARALSTWLYNDDPSSMSAMSAQTARQVAKVAAVDAASGRILIDRPLRFETRPAFAPIVRSFRPSVTNSGIEEMTLEFPTTPWQGEFSELGYNGIAVGTAAHCWVRRIRMVNAEGGVFVSGVHCTIEDVELVATKPPYTANKYLTATGCNGHHGISVGGADNLVTRFDLRMSYVHDLSVEGGGGAGNVFSAGRADDMAFDHHKEAPHGNVFTDIDCGAGNRIWRCGGGADLGRQSAGWETFWNIRAAKSLSYPPAGWGPWSLNLVGFTTTAASMKDPGGIWFEAIDPTALAPANLHLAQLVRRLGHAP